MRACRFVKIFGLAVVLASTSSCADNHPSTSTQRASLATVCDVDVMQVWSSSNTTFAANFMSGGAISGNAAVRATGCPGEDHRLILRYLLVNGNPDGTNYLISRTVSANVIGGLSYWKLDGTLPTNLQSGPWQVAVRATIRSNGVDVATDAKQTTILVSGPGDACGDGNITGAEVCDDENVVTEQECPYGTPECLACNGDCSAAMALTGGFCGDSTIDSDEGEICDDGGPTSACAEDCTLTASQLEVTSLTFPFPCVNTGDACGPNGYYDCQTAVVEVLNTGDTEQLSGWVIRYELIPENEDVFPRYSFVFPDQEALDPGESRSVVLDPSADLLIGAEYTAQVTLGHAAQSSATLPCAAQE
jgi:hypothetical protein